MTERRTVCLVNKNTVCYLTGGQPRCRLCADVNRQTVDNESATDMARDRKLTSDEHRVFTRALRGSTRLVARGDPLPIPPPKGAQVCDPPGDKTSLFPPRSTQSPQSKKGKGDPFLFPEFWDPPCRFLRNGSPEKLGPQKFEAPYTPYYVEARAVD